MSCLSLNYCNICYVYTLELKKTLYQSYISALPTIYTHASLTGKRYVTYINGLTSSWGTFCKMNSNGEKDINENTSPNGLGALDDVVSKKNRRVFLRMWQRKVLRLVQEDKILSDNEERTVLTVCNEMRRKLHLLSQGQSNVQRLIYDQNTELMVLSYANRKGFLEAQRIMFSELDKNMQVKLSGITKLIQEN